MEFKRPSRGRPRNRHRSRDEPDRPRFTQDRRLMRFMESQDRNIGTRPPSNQPGHWPPSDRGSVRIVASATGGTASGMPTLGRPTDWRGAPERSDQRPTGRPRAWLRAGLGRGWRTRAGRKPSRPEAKFLPRLRAQARNAQRAGRVEDRPLGSIRASQTAAGRSPWRTACARAIWPRSEGCIASMKSRSSSRPCRPMV